ncbi:MAG: hypothetical protein MRQ09_06030 [Candidatus Midichloria sp.]|nr:hypothetical protein [Candidatus Midichloria sp.]
MHLWSHQNFTGTYDCYNAMPGFFRSMIIDIGHADMAADPDYVGYIWRDKRLINERIDNNKRLLIAALKLLEEYLVYFQENEPAQKKLIKETKKQLKWDFGQSTKYLLWNFLIAYPVRMRSYIHLSILHDELDIPNSILKMNGLIRL